MNQLTRMRLPQVPGGGQNQAPPGAPGGIVLPGGTADNPLAMGRSGLPSTVTVPLNPIRMGTMMSMEQMRSTVAPVTVVAEVDASRLKAVHDALKPQFEATTGIPLTYTPFFARATVVALQAFPLLNGMLMPQGFIVPRQIHLGVATQVNGGVVVPTIANAELKTIPELARDLYLAAQRARSGVPSQADMMQTFCITNTGRWGSTLFGTPTIKPPNVGILAFEAIMKRPVVAENDQIVARPVMHLALTADHRAVDGLEITGFIGKVKDSLENMAF